MAQTSTEDASSESQMEAPSATVKKPHAVWTAADNETLVGVLENITKKVNVQIMGGRNWPGMQ